MKKKILSLMLLILLLSLEIGGEKMKEDLEKISLKIEEFIREQVERFNKSGVILGLSGG